MAYIGVVGLGHMGGGMAARLVERQHAVWGYDVDDRSRSRARGEGVMPVETIAELAERASIIVTSLPNAAIVRDVWLGEQGLVSSLRPGAVVLEVSTIDPGTMRDLAAASPEGTVILDAPVSGGPVEARAGTLTFLIGGDEASIQLAEPVLGSLGARVHHAGPIGSGKTVKIANNVMSATNTLVAAEAFSTAVAAGMEPRRLFEILAASGGSSGQFVKRFPWALEGDFDPRFTVALATKDLGLALDMARSVGMPAPMTAAAREVYQLAIANGHAGDDMVVLMDMYRGWSH